MSASIPQAPGQTPQAPLVGSGTDYSSLVQGSTDPTDTTLVIRQVIPGMLTFSLPFVCPLLLLLTLLLLLLLFLPFLSEQSKGNTYNRTGSVSCQ
jgi:hypothetical protein